MQGMKALIVGMIAVLALSCGGALAASNDSHGQDASAPQADLSADLGKELVGKRTATSATYRLPSGALQTRIFDAPINYRDSGGQWKPIDVGLQWSKDEVIVNGANRFDVELPKRLGEEPIYFKAGEHWVSSSLLGYTSEKASLAGTTVRYATNRDGVALELNSFSNGVKEEIEIDDPSQPSTFSFELSASDGLRPELTEAGSIEFRNQDNAPVIVIPPPLMYDSAPRRPALSNDLSYELQSRDSGDWLLILEVDRKWLEEDERTWPVRIDPSLHVASPSADCRIGTFKESPVGWGSCGSAGQKLLWIEDYPEGTVAEPGKWGWMARAMVRFDLSSVPSVSAVTAATLGMHSPETAENTSGVQLRRLTQPWTTNVHWWKYDGVALWTNPEGGGDYTGEGTEILTSQRGSQAGWWEFSGNLLPIVQGWVSGAIPNHGALIKLRDDPAECSEDYVCTGRSVKFDSSAAADPSKRPFLDVSYYPPAPAESKLISPSNGQATARRLKLQAQYAAPQTTGVTFQFKVDGISEFQTIPLNAIRDADGNEVTWPLPVQNGHTDPIYLDALKVWPALKDEPGPFYVRALFDGPIGAGGFSEAVKTEVNVHQGGAFNATEKVGPGTVNLLTGNFTTTRSDVGIKGPISNLEFSRTYNSRGSVSGENTSVLGPGWKPSVTVEAAGGARWRSVRKIIPSTEEEEEGIPEYAVLTDLEGYEYAFDWNGSGYESPTQAPGWILAVSSSNLALTDPDGNRTTFSNGSGGSEYLPISVSQTGGENNRTRFVYQIVEGKRRLSTMTAASAAGVTCTEEKATSTLGCRTLTFSYKPASTWGGEAGLKDRLASITYYGPTGPNSMSNWEVAKYSYNAEGRLIEAWDPRISPALKESYGYYEGRLATITPPGEESWSLTYNGSTVNKEYWGSLVRVSRASLLESPVLAETTIVYGVPTTGSGAPHNLSGSEVAKWGQTRVPTDATAIFPPDQVPALNAMPESYSRATIYYMDAEGQLVNTRTPAGAGTSAASIRTTEYDKFGNVVRELTARNRNHALSTGAESATKAEVLDTKYQYSADGTQMELEVGPLHEFRLESGEIVEGRRHKKVEYDKNAPEPPAGTPMPHLPTRETAYGVSSKYPSVELDKRVTEIQYNWNLRKPTDRIVDPGGLNLRTHTEYDSVTGLPTEKRLPANPNGGDARTTKVIYYASGESSHNECGHIEAWAGLPCRILAAGPGAEGHPEPLVKGFIWYGPMAEPSQVIDGPGGYSGTYRITYTTFDAAGRPMLVEQTGGEGESIPPTQTVYSQSTGRPVIQRFICESNCGSFDSREIITTHDTLGRVIEYQDADGNTSTTTYDLLGRPVTTSDGKGIQTRSYDPTSGLLVQLEDSAAGTFTASYDADGNLTEKTLPNGLRADTTYNETGTPVHLSYEKATNCSTKCNWLDFEAEESVHGQWLAQTSSLSAQEYGYDKAGRLVQVKDTSQPQYVEPPVSKPTFATSFGSSGTGNGQFDRPGEIAFAPNGDIWITDTYNHRIQHFDSEGNYLGKFGSEGTGNGQFQRPRGIEFDSEGNFWVLDSLNNRLQKFNDKGEYLTKWGVSGTSNGKLKTPKGFTIDSEGNFWISDTLNARIQKFSPNGTFLKVAGTSGPGDLAEPLGISTSPAGEVYVADWTQNRVVVFDSEGEYERAFGTEGEGDGEFGHPVEVDVDPVGNVWVGDQLNQRVQQFDTEGNYVDQFGTGGDDEGEIDPISPMGITTDAEGSIWLTDTGNDRVEKWEFKEQPNPPTYANSFGSTGTGNGQLDHPGDLVVAPDGDIWVADTYNNRIQHFDPEGNYVGEFGSAGTGNGQFERPRAIEFDAQGNIWVLDSLNERLQKFNDKGEYLTKWGSYGSSNGKLDTPKGLAIDHEGNFWVADTTNDRIQKFTPNGTFLKVAGTSGPGDLSDPVSLDVSPEGEVFVVDRVQNRVVVFNSEGEYERAFGTEGDGDGQLDLPLAIDVDAQGNVWVGDEMNKRVQQFDLQGNYVAQFGTEGSGNGEMDPVSPMGITTDGKGSIWLTDSGNDRMQLWEHPVGGCTTRAYTYDANSNRTKQSTHVPGVGGSCNPSSTGSTQAYSYDSIDRLLDEGLTYDNYGRITNLPSKFAGGGALVSTYYVNDLVKSQTQDGITNTYHLDSALRQRQRTQSGSVSGTEIYHYADGSDAPAWIDYGSAWSRNIEGIEGDLAAIQDSEKGTVLQLGDLHGDVVAIASLDPEATGLLETFEFDEFGNPKGEVAPRFGWLGGKQRRTELPSGVIQMGLRSYVPMLGRFLSTDPVLGGSANAYDYANADPVNGLDLTGMKPLDTSATGPCKGKLQVSSRRGNPVLNRGGYGRFNARYRISCGAATYKVRVLKVTRRLERVGGPIITESSNMPANPSGPHWQEGWGNWNRPTSFTCLYGQEYQYTYEIQIKWASPCGLLEGLCPPGEGTLRLTAQEYCGHG